MNEPNEDLEVELADLRPHGATPELRQRIANHQARSGSPSSRWRWGLAVASSLAAASAVVVLLRVGGGRDAGPKPNVALTKPEHKPPPSVVVEDASSTFLMYRHALARSPENLDALLAQDALVAQNSDLELAQISAFTRFDAALQSLVGED